MIVTLGGEPGSGKGTVGRLLAKRLGYSYYSMGDIWGEAAKKEGMSLNEFHGYLQQNPGYDHKLDEYQRSLGEQDNLVIDSRLGFHFIPKAYKVFLTVDADEAARRVLGTDREDEHYGSIEEARVALQDRAEHERAQYRKIYGIDHHDHANYDLVIDTTSITPEQVADIILEKLQR